MTRRRPILPRRRSCAASSPGSPRITSVPADAGINERARLEVVIGHGKLLLRLLGQAALGD